MVFVYTGVFSEYNIIIHYNSVKKYIERIFKNIGIGYLLMAIRRSSSLPDVVDVRSDVYIGRTLLMSLFACGTKFISPYGVCLLFSVGGPTSRCPCSRSVQLS